MAHGSQGTEGSPECIFFTLNTYKLTFFVTFCTCKILCRYVKNVGAFKVYTTKATNIIYCNRANTGSSRLVSAPLRFQAHFYVVILRLKI